jgi:peptidoglycan/LPS O-acetylase OafA/YrhL
MRQLRSSNSAQSLRFAGDSSRKCPGSSTDFLTAVAVRATRVTMGARDTYYDYIRAFAALLVLFCHKGKMPGGAIGVSIFFCLSGFLITKILIGLPCASAPNIAKFVFRRFIRIFPLYCATLAAAMLLAWLYQPERLSKLIAGLPGLLTFTKIPAEGGYATAVAWSLHAEFWFYVCFPVVFAITYKRGLLPLAIVALISVSIVVKIFGGLAETWPIASGQWLTIAYLDQLMYGAICAVLVEKRSAIVGLFSSKLWFWGPLCANLMMAKLAPLNHWHLEMSAAALLCAVAILHHEASKQTLDNNFIAWLGRISFSLYLVHAVVLDYLPYEKLPDILDTPSFLVVVLTLSFFTERLVERPGIRLGHSIARFGAFRRKSDDPQKAISHIIRMM